MTHPIIENGPLPVDAHAALWRYVSLPALLLYLDGRLRLPSVLALRRLDRLEGLAAWDHVTQTEGFSADEREQLWEYFYSSLSARDQELFSRNAALPGVNQRRVYEHWHRLVVSTRYALCFFLAEHESIAMWRLYAPQGFAIRTSLDSLNKALGNGKQRWRISRMKYWDKSKEINPDQTHADPQLKSALRRPFLLKSREYQYENEVRLFTVDGHARPNLLVETVAPEDWIEEIRVSPEIWSEDAELLRDLIKSRCSVLEKRIGASPIASAPIQESCWSDIDADVSHENAAKNWPPFLREP